jgi:hypothetical protein
VTRLGALDAGKISTTSAEADKHTDTPQDPAQMAFQKELHDKL